MAEQKWSTEACLRRADGYLKVWAAKAEAAALVHAALELRWGLELYLLSRVEEITGERPRTEGREPLELLDEALLLHEDARLPQSWSLGIGDDLKENPLRAMATGIPELTLKKARTFYGQLMELSHATVLYGSRAESPVFWVKQHSQLLQIHAELCDICLGTGNRVTTPDLGKDQGAIL